MPQIDRRSFLVDSACSVTAIAASSALFAESAVAKSEPSERLRVGCVGVGGRAGYLLRTFASLKDVEIVAVADIDSRPLPAALEAVAKLPAKTTTAEGDFFEHLRR